MGKGVIDERLPQYIGTAALSSGDYIHRIIKQSDLIVAVGYDTIEKPTTIIETGTTDVVHINYTTADYDMLYRPRLQVVGDIGNTFWQLDESDIDTRHWDFDDIYRDSAVVKQTIVANADKHYDADMMLPGRLVRETRAVLSDQDIVALDNGLYKLRFARNYETHYPNRLLLDNALASM